MLVSHFCQVRRYTTSRPKTLAGKDLYTLAKDLFNVKTMDQALVWINELSAWRMTYSDFLREMTIDEFGNKLYLHFWNVLILQYLQQIIVLKVE